MYICSHLGLARPGHRAARDVSYLIAHDFRFRGNSLLDKSTSFD